MTLLKHIAFPVALSLSLGVWAQETPKTANWQHEKGLGMETDKAYKKVLKKKKSKTVIVAVLDSGVDIDHEDLKDHGWTNDDEIPNNGIDDDNNGYIDDVHGWNFLGNANGENVQFDNLEMARIFAKLSPKYDILIKSDIATEDLKEYELFLEVKGKITEKATNYSSSLVQYKMIDENIDGIVEYIENKYGEGLSAKKLAKLKVDDEMDQARIALAIEYKQDPKAFKTQIEEGVEYLSNYLEYYINPEFNSRTIVGDDPTNFSQTSYGNNDVQGPDALHGTHVAGIIGATRNNSIGINGVADDVQIMSVRTVPDGDERDKDVALAIKYAVDNGASIVNMSFGKGYSPFQQEVYDAIVYAQSKGVLLIHAAGNDASNVDTVPNFPSNHYELPQRAPFTHYLTIGASTYKKKEIPANFSNYGQEYVDVFAPGFEIYATIPDNKYKNLQGTSMAAPQVAGVAALLKSYYPELSMEEIKDIILNSAVSYKESEVVIPGGTDKVNFGTLSQTGAVVNVYKAVLLAEEKTKE